MGGIFNMDSPLMQGLSRVADMVVLNLMTVLCSIPVFTAGAAETALYDATTRMLRDEGNLYSSFWRAFRSNFKQATGLWLIILVAGLLVSGSVLFYLTWEISGGIVLLVIAGALLMLWAVTAAWVFPLQARFENSVKNTLKNAVLCAMAYLPHSLVMAVLNLLPLALFLVMPDLFLRIGFIWLGIWFALATYFNCRLLKKPMDKLIAQAEARQAQE